jgi:glycyl-tRNA synthetase beta chain
MPDFLLEVGLEEIPARMIAPAQAELAQRVEDLLLRERLLSAGHEVHSYSTPRRLAVLVKGVSAGQADVDEQLTGPSWSVAFRNGEPTPAAHAFAKKAGVEVSALTKATTPKGEYAAATAHRKGRAAAEILTDHLAKEIGGVYWPKNMYWRAGKPERFVRPVKWLLALLDHAIVPVEFAGVHAANLTYGHRILHGREPMKVERAKDYLAVLETAHVLADVELRRHRIRKGLDAVTRTVPGARWREDEALVDAVTHLTEWPTVLLGSFEADYLQLPEEVLVTVMRDHQKYFAVEDAQGRLAPHFLTVLNTAPEDGADAVIRHGNERVLRARFNDARFFWEFDQRVLLKDRVEMLKSVTFQKDLGSYWDKTEANLRIAEQLADTAVHFEGMFQGAVAVDKRSLLNAVQLAKTDLTTELVKEFTELQGIVGGLYARAQGLGEGVAQAIYWQYSPAGMEDPIPPTVEGQILGIADRFQTITAMFGIGLEPTGSKDPFGLRRAANGIVKILAESQLPLEFAHLEKCVPAGHAETAAKLKEFFKERLEFYLRDVRGFAYDVVNAVLAAGFDDVRDAVARAEALTAVRGSEDFAAIAAAFKRMKNIVRQAEEKGGSIPISFPDQALFRDDAERGLSSRASQVGSDFQNLRRVRKYREALELIATLRPNVDLFFDKVMVMVEDEAVRNNRLILIAQILSAFSSVADFSEIMAG